MRRRLGNISREDLIAANIGFMTDESRARPQDVECFGDVLQGGGFLMQLELPTLEEMSGLWYRLVVEHKILTRVFHEKTSGQKFGYSAKADSGGPSFGGRVMAIFAKEPIIVKWFAEIASMINGTLITDAFVVHYHHRYNKLPQMELEKTWRKSNKKNKKQKSAKSA